MLVLQALHGLSLARTSYLVRDRLSWMRFCGLGPGDAVPDENTLWDFREALIAAGALEKLFERLNAAIERAGYLAMGGQIVDASIVEAPKQRNTKEEKADIKAGRVPEGLLGSLTENQAARRASRPQSRSFGRGGQPGMCRSTGRTSETRPTQA